MRSEVIGNTDKVAGFLEEQNEFVSVYASGPSWLQKVRNSGKEYFSNLGIPEIKHEEWKYFHISKVLREQYSLSKNTSNSSIHDISKYLISGNDVIKIVCINGKYSLELSDNLNINGSEIAAGTLHDKSTDLSEIIFSNKAKSTDHFLSLNTSFINEITSINIFKGIKIDKPIHIIHLIGSSDNETMVFPRTIISAGEGSEVEVIESYHSTNGSTHSFCAAVTEVVEDKNAKVTVTKYQDMNEDAILITNTYFSLQRDSKSDIHTYTINGGMVRNNLAISLNGENCHAELHGVYLPNGSQVVDNHTLVDHVSPNCYSNELYKGVMGDKSEAIFNGKVFVHRDAQKTNAYQSNNNILLTDDATINTKPQLEIYADDVKCSHGATTGQLDEDALFYLRARGIGEKEARALLVVAFAGEVLELLENETLKNNISDIINDRLSNMSQSI